MLFLHWHVLWTCNTQFLKIHPKTWWPLVVKMEATCFSLFFIRYYLDYHGHKCYHGSQLTTILNGKPLWPQDAYKLCIQKKPYPSDTNYFWVAAHSANPSLLIPVMQLYFHCLIISKIIFHFSTFDIHHSKKQTLQLQVMRKKYQSVTKRSWM